MVLNRLGIKYFHETFGESNRRGFRKLKDRTERFYNNIDPKTVKNIEEIALLHNILNKTKIEKVSLVISDRSGY